MAAFEACWVVVAVAAVRLSVAWQLEHSPVVVVAAVVVPVVVPVVAAVVVVGDVSIRERILAIRVVDDL